jgi:hypothetical protein
MSADIHTLPGVDRHDIGPEVSVAHILGQAIDLETVVVIGYGPQGWYLASSSPDMDRNIGMVMRAVHDMLHTDTAEFISGGSE